MAKTAACYLIKSEPSVYSFAQLCRDGQTRWDGVRNFEARNNLRLMRVGDLLLYYHSNEGKEVVGVAQVVTAAYPDPTAPDEDWSAVNVAPVRALSQPVTLAAIKSEPKLAEMALVRKSRISVVPVTAAEFALVLQMGGTTLKDTAAAPQGSLRASSVGAFATALGCYGLFDDHRVALCAGFTGGALATRALGLAETSRAIADQLRSQLGTETVVASSVNGTAGLWIGFPIEKDSYWLQIDLIREGPMAWNTITLWVSMALLATVLGSAAIARSGPPLVGSRPLAVSAVQAPVPSRMNMDVAAAVGSWGVPSTKR